jgi:hypothetical protein
VIRKSSLTKGVDVCVGGGITTGAGVCVGSGFVKVIVSERLS